MMINWIEFGTNTYNYIGAHILINSQKKLNRNEQENGLNLGHCSIRWYRELNMNATNRKKLIEIFSHNKLRTIYTYNV